MNRIQDQMGDIKDFFMFLGKEVRNREKNLITVNNHVISRH